MFIKKDLEELFLLIDESYISDFFFSATNQTDIIEYILFQLSSYEFL